MANKPKKDPKEWSKYHVGDTFIFAQGEYKIIDVSAEGLLVKPKNKSVSIATSIFLPFASLK